MMEFQLNYFKSSKMMLWMCCTQYASKFGKLSSGYGTGKAQFSFQSQISHAIKGMLKIFQARLQQYMNHELPDIQAGFRKGRGTKDKMPTSAGSSKKQESSRKKHLLLLYWLCQRLWLCGSQETGKFWKRWEYQTTWPASWEICIQVKKQQLGLDMKQQTGSNQEKSKSRLYIVTLLT